MLDMSYLTVNPITPKRNLWQNSPINLLLALEALGPYNHEFVKLERGLGNIFESIHFIHN
jgi:hypothetical protein